MKTIKAAAPLNQELIRELIKNGELTNVEYDDGKISIPPETAKWLMQKGIIKDPHDFVCSTNGCNTPITCCSFRPANKKTTYYMTPKEKRDLHIEECKYHVSHIYKSNEKKSNSTYKFEKDNKVVTTFNRETGFVKTASKSNNETSVITKTSSNDDSQQNTNVYKSNNTNQNKRTINTSVECENVKDHVELLMYDPECLVESPDTGKLIPNKALFTSMKNNKFFNDVTSSDYFRIYKGDMTIRQMQSGDFIGWLDNEVVINEQTFKPSIFLTEEFIENNYPTKYEEYKDKSSINCKVYLTYYYFLDEEKNFLNFAQFGTGRKLTSRTPYIEDNIHLI